MSRTPSPSPSVPNLPSVDAPASPKPEVKAEKKSDHYWFGFDRWLPITPSADDEFVLA